MKCKPLAIVLITLGCSGIEQVRPDGPSIVIQDHAVGCFHSIKHDYEWVDRGELGYQLGSRTISHEEVERLRQLVLRANTATDKLPELIGLTPESLQENWDQILEMALPVEWAGLESKLPTRLAESLTYDQVAGRAISELQGPTRSTNTRYFSIELPGEPTFKIVSDVDRLWMLPWNVTSGETQWSIVDPRLSEALLMFADPEGPAAFALDGQNYREKGIWQDRAFWSSFIDEPAVAQEIYSQIVGFAAFEQQFEINSAIVGSVNLQPNSMYFELSPRENRAIDSIRWWNPLIDGTLTATWQDYLAVYSVATAAVEREEWLVEWKQAGEDRSIRLEAVGATGHREINMELFVDPIWADSGLQGAPEFELQLRRNGFRCGTVFLAENESGALITMARRPHVSNWPAELDFSYHPRSTPPTYGLVNAAGEFELRVLGK